MITMIDYKTKTAAGVELKRKEFELLEYFVKNPNVVITREKIVLAVWGEDQVSRPRVMDAQLHYLRKKIPNLPIKNRSGLGFIYQP
jgi:DNA-binding response OmpR family regulator